MQYDRPWQGSSGSFKGKAPEIKPPEDIDWRTVKIGELGDVGLNFPPAEPGEPDYKQYAAPLALAALGGGGLAAWAAQHRAQNLNDAPAGEHLGFEADL